MAKKISLREFQQNLIARLTSAAKGQRSTAQLGIQSGRDFWLINLPEAGEIVPLPTLTPVPLTKPWFSGIANIRGNLYSVADFSGFQGNEPTPQNTNSRLLLVGEKLGTNAALLVSRTLGLRNLDQFTPEAASEEQPAWVAETYRDGEGRFWKKLNVRELLSHPDFLQIGA